MKPFVRRSHLLVDVTDTDVVKASWTYNADAVILTMPVGGQRAINSAWDNYQRRSTQPRWAALTCSYLLRETSLMRTSNQQSGSASRAWSILEPSRKLRSCRSTIGCQVSKRRRGIAENTLHVIVMLSSGAGVWHIREIVRASDRGQFRWNR